MPVPSFRLRHFSRLVRSAPRRAGRISVQALRANLLRPSLPAVSLPRPSAGRAAAAHVLAEWRDFFGPSHRLYARLAIAAGSVATLSGMAVLLPLLISAGVGAGLATLIGVAILAGPAAQLFVPTLLRRSGGQLRRATLICAAIGETRGLWLAPLVLLAGLNHDLVPLLIGGIVVAIALAGVFGGVAAANLQAWFAVILPEPERRLVAPRVAGLGLATGALVLLPASLAVSFLAGQFGLIVYAVPFLVAGLAGLAELAVMARLPRPGRVRVPKLPAAGARPELGRFVIAAAIAAFGAGLAPYFVVYAMAGLGFSAGAAIALSAFTSAISLLASTVAAIILARRSSSRLLRRAWAMLGTGWLLMLGSLPFNPFGLAVFIGAVAVISAGGALAQLATNERLMRLAGADAIAFQGRFVAVSAGTVSVGQLLASALLMVSGPGVVAFGFLFVVSGATRLLAANRLEISLVSSETKVYVGLGQTSRA